MNCTKISHRWLPLMTFAIAGTGSILWGQIYTPGPAPVPVLPAQPGAQPPPVAQSIPRWNDQQLADMTASIALYPDPLLAQMLPAATYVEDVVVANRWVTDHPGADELAIQGTPYQPSVKAVMHYPTVLTLLADNADWTRALGMAFVYQPADVTSAIQKWRWTALAVGTLASNPQQQVINTNGYIQIVPAEPQVVYVPTYDPAVVYVRGPRLQDAIHFNIGKFGVWLDGDLDWHDHVVRLPAQPYWERHDWDDHRHEWAPRPGVVVRGDGHPDDRRPFVRNDFRPDGKFPDRFSSPDHRDIRSDGHGPTAREH